MKVFEEENFPVNAEKYQSTRTAKVSSAKYTRIYELLINFSTMPFINTKVKDRNAEILKSLRNCKRHVSSN